ncbi:MAG: YbaK/EbsC family protein [Actinomycetota bacterium]
MDPQVMPSSDTPASVQRVIDAARACGVEPNVQTFPEGTRTAQDAARAVGCDVAQIVKTLVWFADDRPVIVMVSGSNRLDPEKLANFAHAHHCRAATANEAKATTGFAIGGTPPFGHAGSHSSPISAYLDASLLKHKTVWVAAGTPHTVFAIEPALLRNATNATVAQVAEDTD